MLVVVVLDDATRSRARSSTPGRSTSTGRSSAGATRRTSGSRPARSGWPPRSPSRTRSSRSRSRSSWRGSPARGRVRCSSCWCCSRSGRATSSGSTRGRRSSRRPGRSTGRSNGLGLPDAQLAFTNKAMWIVFSYVWLPFMILPIYAALERIPGSLLEASARSRARAVLGRFGASSSRWRFPGSSQARSSRSR